MKQVHVLVANLIKIVFALDAHGRDLYPVTVLPIASGSADLAEINLWIEVGGEGITVIAAVAVQDVNRVDGIKFMLLCVSNISLGDTGIEAAAEQGSKSSLFKFLLISPLPAIIEVCGEASFLATLLIDGTPLGIIRVLGFIVCRVHVVDLAGKAGIHDGQILIGKCNVHHQIRLITINQVD